MSTRTSDGSVAFLPAAMTSTLSLNSSSSSSSSSVVQWSAKAQSYIDLLSSPLRQPSVSPQQRIQDLRQLILLESLPPGEEGNRLRPLVWKLLLNLHELPASDIENDDDDDFELDLKDVHPLLDEKTYQSLISREPSPMFSKIRNDTFRTLATDLEFKDRVGEDRLVRCLEAFVWRQLDRVEHEEHHFGESSGVIDAGTPYVQGMNVLAAPFLYVLPSQIEAFACFSTFIEDRAPRYVRPTLDGVHAGLHLVDLCLAALDPPLHAHLLTHRLTAELYAFPSLLTFCASTPPLHEVLQLWDFLLAWGVGLNVVCVVAQLWLMRDLLLVSNSPMKLLRTLPPLRSKEIIPLTVQFIGELDAELYSAVVRHPWDDTLILNR